MKKVYITSTIPTQNISDKKIIVFKESYKIEENNKVRIITSASLALEIIKIANKKIGTNSEEKAKQITDKLSPDFELYLVYSDPIPNKESLTNKVLLIIEQNQIINEIDAQKIILLPPWPYILDKVQNMYPNHKLEALTEEDESIFRVNYFNSLIKEC